MIFETIFFWRSDILFGSYPLHPMPHFVILLGTPRRNGPLYIIFYDRLEDFMHFLICKFWKYVCLIGTNNVKLNVLVLFVRVDTSAYIPRRTKLWMTTMINCSKLVWNLLLVSHVYTRTWKSSHILPDCRHFFVFSLFLFFCFQKYF